MIQEEQCFRFRVMTCLTQENSGPLVILPLGSNYYQVVPSVISSARPNIDSYRVINDSLLLSQCGVLGTQ